MRPPSELVELLLDADRAKKELEASMARGETLAVIRSYYDRYREALAAKKAAGL